MRLILTETSWDSATLAHDLTALGCRVNLVADGGEMNQYLGYGTVHGVVIDADLPDMAAPVLVRQIRAHHPVLPILVVQRKPDRALGGQLYRAGADAVVAGGSEAIEVAARLWAMAMRVAGFAEPVLAAHGLTLDVLKRTAQVDGRRVPLTRREFELIETLALAGGRPVRAEALMETLYADAEDEPLSKVLATFLCNARRKIVEAGGARDVIETVSGFGYRFAVARPTTMPTYPAAEMHPMAEAA